MPYRILAARISDSDILDERTRIIAPFGPFRPPKSISSKIPGVFGRDSCSLLDFVARVVEQGPPYVILCAKSGVSKGPGGWDLTYYDKCEVVKVSDVGPAKTKTKDRAREEHGRNESDANRPGVCSSSMLEQVGGTFSPEKYLVNGDTDEVSEAETVLEGEEDSPSDDEYLRALRPSNVDATDAVREMITRSIRVSNVLMLEPPFYC